MLEKLLHNLNNRGIHFSHDGNTLTYRPAGLLTPDEMAIIRNNKRQIISLLSGYYEIKRNDPILTESGKETIWEVYPESQRVGVIQKDNLVRFYGFSEVSSMTHFNAMKARFEFIEYAIYKEMGENQTKAFDFYKVEWHFLMRELNRQKFMIETLCGPMKAIGGNKQKGGQNEMRFM